MVVEQFDQHREIVVVAEGLGEPVELFHERAEHAGGCDVHQLHLVPEVLGALSPLVEAVVGRIGACPTQR